MLYVHCIDDIYQVYTVHIHGIFQAYAHVTNMPGIYPLHTSWVCSKPYGSGDDDASGHGDED